MPKYDRIAAVVFILVSIVLWTQTMGLQYNCYVFPRMLIVLLIGLSAIMFAKTFRKTAAAEKEAGGLRDDLKYIVICLAVVVVWIYLVDILGFIVSGVIFLTILTRILDLERFTVGKTVYAIVVYSVVIFLFWVAFAKLLLVPLPTGYFI